VKRDEVLDEGPGPEVAPPVIFDIDVPAFEAAPMVS
jgi:hypothetical protein